VGESTSGTVLDGTIASADTAGSSGVLTCAQSPPFGTEGLDGSNSEVSVGTATTVTFGSHAFGMSEFPGTGTVDSSTGLSSSEGLVGSGSPLGRKSKFVSSELGKVSTSLGKLGSSSTSGSEGFGSTLLVSKGSGSEVFSSSDSSRSSGSGSSTFGVKGSKSVSSEGFHASEMDSTSVGALAGECSLGSAGEVVPFTVLEHLNTVFSSVVVGLSSVPRSEVVSLVTGPDPVLLFLDIVVTDPSGSNTVLFSITS